MGVGEYMNEKHWQETIEAAVNHPRMQALEAGDVFSEKEVLDMVIALDQGIRKLTGPANIDKITRSYLEKFKMALLKDPVGIDLVKFAELRKGAANEISEEVSGMGREIAMKNKGLVEGNREYIYLRKTVDGFLKGREITSVTSEECFANKEVISAYHRMEDMIENNITKKSMGEISAVVYALNPRIDAAIHAALTDALGLDKVRRI